MRPPRRRQGALVALSLVVLAYFHQEQVTLQGIVSQSWQLSDNFDAERTPNASQFAGNASVAISKAANGSLNNPIRSWGCGRTETPFIFLHIGKMGGGSVRARFAAAALDYNRSSWASSNDYTAYYPVSDTEKGHFCNSGLYNFRYWHRKTFEGTFECKALTPIGQAIACPAYVDRFSNDCGKVCAVDSTHCHRIYVGHNLLGNEIHHLPPRYLQAWWTSLESVEQGRQLPVAHSGYATIDQLWKLIDVNNTNWCPTTKTARPFTIRQANALRGQCAVPLAQQFDEVAQNWINQVAISTRWPENSTLHDSAVANLDPSANWGPLYASMPILRTTAVREPFSWFVSKFFWSRLHHSASCGDVDTALWRPHVPVNRSIPDNAARGWCHRFAMEFILHVCGEDCRSRYDAIGETITASEEKIWVDSFLRQAEYNMRQSIAVVGLSEDLDSYFDMVTRRVHYLNMSLNLHVTGPRHPSGASDECKKVFTDEKFRRILTGASPAVAAAVKLYETALQVHSFQKAELESCQHDALY